jgi:hypothetical protein
VVYVELHPNDDETEGVVALHGHKGAVTGDILSTQPLENLKGKYPTWDGKYNWLDAAYGKFKARDPRPLIAALHGLTPELRREKLPLPPGIGNATPAPESNGIAMLLGEAQALRRSTESLGQSLVDADLSSNDDGDNDSSSEDEPSALKPKSLFEMIDVTSKRPRASITRFEAEPASRAKKKIKGGKAGTTAEPEPPKRSCRVEEPIVSLGEIKLTKQLETASTERDRSKSHARSLEKQLSEVTATVKALQAQKAQNDSVSDVLIENKTLKLLLFSVKEVAVSYFSDSVKMCEAITRIAKGFGIDLSD